MFKKQATPFDSIRQVDENGNEFWSARALAKVLGYSQFNKAQGALTKAKEACLNSGQSIEQHFEDSHETVTVGHGTKRNYDDVHLSRYACYLVVQNADPSKEIVALGQTYFAVQTRQQELAEQYANLPEDQKRLLQRGELNTLNTQLAKAARKAGVVEPQDFAVFQEHGYAGLYGGLKSTDIHKRKGLGEGQKILDYMGSDELAANTFRASQTRQKIEREQIQDKENANRAHFQVGNKVRQTIEELGSTLPENLPTPKESIKQLQAKEEKRRRRGSQLSLFEE